MAFSTTDIAMVEQRVEREAPNAGAAYLLWFFLWWVSAHRFYLGRPGTAILQILSYFVLIGFVWAFVDAFLIPGMIRDREQQIRNRLAGQLLTHRA